MPRRSIRLPTCLQERLVPLLRLVFLAPLYLFSFPKPFPSTVFFPLSSFYFSFWCSLGSSFSHHFYFIRSHLVVNTLLFFFFLMTHATAWLGLSCSHAFHHTRIISLCLIAKSLDSEFVAIAPLVERLFSRVFAIILSSVHLSKHLA